VVLKRALERWGPKLENCKVTPQAIWHIAKSLTKRSGPKAPPAINGHLGSIFYPIYKPQIILDCLENHFRAHDLCDNDHRKHVKVIVEAMLDTVKF
jgi:hypothetical protein